MILKFDYMNIPDIIIHTKHDHHNEYLYLVQCKDKNDKTFLFLIDNLDELNTIGVYTVQRLYKIPKWYNNESINTSNLQMKDNENLELINKNIKEPENGVNFMKDIDNPSDNTVYKKTYHKANIQKEELEKLLSTINNIEEIAKYKNVSVTTIYNYIRKYDIKYDGIRKRREKI